MENNHNLGGAQDDQYKHDEIDEVDDIQRSKRKKSVSMSASFIGEDCQEYITPNGILQHNHIQPTTNGELHK